MSPSSLPYVEVHSQQSKFAVSCEDLRKLAVQILQLREQPLRLSVVLVDDRDLRRLHREYCGDDSITDVISFDLRNPSDPQEFRSHGFDAELVISAERAHREARARKVKPGDELALYLVHGVLHLAGLKDHTEEERARMRKEEKRILNQLGLPHTF